jgi:gluconolactonase
MKWRFVVTALVVCFTLAKLCVAQKEPKREFQLQANNPNFWKLFEREAKLETVASGFGFTEGRVWDPAGFVYVSDEETNKIFRVYMDGRKEELISLGDPDGNTYDHEKRLIDCASVLRAIIRIDRGGKYEVLAERFEGKRFNSPNDVVTGPDGAIYFTDPTLDLPKGEKQEVPFHGVYRLDASGNVSLLTKQLSQPNGLAFSPDGKRLYVDDSERRNIWVFDFTSEHKLANGRIFGEEPGGKGDGVPDGIKVDQGGICTLLARRESGFGILRAITLVRSFCRSNPRILHHRYHVSLPVANEGARLRTVFSELICPAISHSPEHHP